MGAKIEMNIPVPVQHRLVWLPVDSKATGVQEATEQTLGQAGWRSTSEMENRLTALLDAAGLPGRGDGHDGIDQLKAFIYEISWTWGPVLSIPSESTEWLQRIADIGIEEDEN